MRFSILFCILILLFSTKAGACDCEQKHPLTASVKEAAIIFKGKVVDVIYTRIIKDSLDIINPDSVSYQKSPFRYAAYVYRFKVARLYKGKGNHSVEVISALSSGECGYPFKKGKTYIVYAENGKALDKEGRIIKTITTTSCTRTNFYSAAEERLIKRKMALHKHCR